MKLVFTHTPCELQVPGDLQAKAKVPMLRVITILSLLLTSTTLFSQTGQNQTTPGENQTRPLPTGPPPTPYIQELDADGAALAKIPADPLIAHDLFSEFLKPVDEANQRLAKSSLLTLSATYTFVNQYATITPDSVRHNQTTGRLDFNAGWAAYDHGTTAGSFSLLLRSATNIGLSQGFNLSDQLGSSLFLNCLQGGGRQLPISINILYYRQDLLSKRLSFYIGKLHPNQHISLSMYNNDERSQFLNGENDGNLAIASDGVYAGGAALEFQATHHLYIHTLAVDTEGAANRGIGSLIDRKYLEAAEVGWFVNTPGNRYHNYRFVVYREDTRNLGSGYGGGFAFEHEFSNGWAPFGRYGFSSDRGTSIKQTDSIGLTNVRPFGRRGDMFGAAFNYTEPNHTGYHHESLFESFYRLRLTRSLEIGPDIQVSIHPTNIPKAYTTTLLGARMRILF